MNDETKVEGGCEYFILKETGEKNLPIHHL